MVKQRFRYSASILKKSHLFAVLGSLLAFILGSLLLLELPNLSDLDFSQLFLDEHGNTPFQLQLFAVVLLLGTIVALAQRQVRVELDSESLTIHIPRLTSLGLMGLTTGDHRIPIGTIKSVELTPVTGIRNVAQAIQQSRLSIVTDRQTYRLQPYNFLREGGSDHRMGFSGAFGKSKSKVETLINDAPLVQALSGVASSAKFTSTPVDRTGPLAKHFNLLKHKGMIIQLILLVGLGTYALVDYLLLTNYLVVGGMPIWPFIAGALLAGVLGVQLGKGAPPLERLGLAVLLGIMAAVAIYPGEQRYTLVTSSKPMAITYRMTEAGYFEHARYPTIDQRQSSIPEYWQSLPLGENHTFSLYESGQGFALIDMAPVYEKSRAFYLAR